MGPKPTAPETDELFVSRLDELINMRHPLVRLAGGSWRCVIETYISSSATYWHRMAGHLPLRVRGNREQQYGKRGQKIASCKNFQRCLPCAGYNTATGLSLMHSLSPSRCARTQ